MRSEVIGSSVSLKTAALGFRWLDEKNKTMAHTTQIPTSFNVHSSTARALLLYTAHVLLQWVLSVGKLGI